MPRRGARMERAMTTHRTVVLAAAVVVYAGGVCAHAQPVATTGTWRSPAVKRMNTLRAGSITSLVRDASGAPVSGAIVSAVGGRTLAGTTDAKGRCTLAELPAGEYPRPACIAQGLEQRTAWSFASRPAPPRRMTWC